MNVQCKRCGLGKTRLRHPSLPFNSPPYPTRTIRRRVRSVNHVTTKGKEVDHNLWVWGSVPRARSARGSPAKKICFSSKVPIYGSRPKSDSAPCGAIEHNLSQTAPAKPHQGYSEEIPWCVHQGISQKDGILYWDFEAC